MASEWAKKKAEAVCREWEFLRPDDWVTPQLRDMFAAALDEARRERDREWATTLWPCDPEGQAALETMTPADGAAWYRTQILAAEGHGEKRGAERERLECHEAVSNATCGDDAQYSIAARGPMRGPEEG